MSASIRAARGVLTGAFAAVLGALVFCSPDAGVAAQELTRLYAPKPPPGSAYVRVVDLARSGAPIALGTGEAASVPQGDTATLYRIVKGGVPLEDMTPGALVDYSGIVGHLLAKGHARTSGASVIAGYLGKKDEGVEAFVRWARAYADQTEADHALLVEAVRAGRLPSEPGV